MYKTLQRDSVFFYFLLNLAYFPIWWYSFGFLEVVKYAFNFLVHRESGLGFLIWAANLFTPMYGQTDLAGRLISLLVRSIQIVLRGSIMLVWVFMAIILVLGWLAAPILLINGLIINLNA